MLVPRLRYRNVRAGVPDILQQSLRDGEVVSPNWPRGRFVRLGRGSERFVHFGLFDYFSTF